MSEQRTAPYELRLMEEIAALDRQIADLGAEKAALTRQLMKAREHRGDLRDVNRRNSVHRVIIENAIIDMLVKQGGTASNKGAYKYLRENVLHDLNENTLRTYLHRMKEKGMISNPYRGVWKIEGS